MHQQASSVSEVQHLFILLITPVVSLLCQKCLLGKTNFDVAIINSAKLTCAFPGKTCHINVCSESMCMYLIYSYI